MSTYIPNIDTDPTFDHLSQTLTYPHAYYGRGYVLYIRLSEDGDLPAWKFSEHVVQIIQTKNKDVCEKYGIDPPEDDMSKYFILVRHIRECFPEASQKLETEGKIFQGQFEPFAIELSYADAITLNASLITADLTTDFPYDHGAPDNGIRHILYGERGFSEL